ncbi:MAG: PspC domain-containing protein [Bacteroidia bacterium]|nr:PspC domain-containing protein [Bacteroidia bacterium]NNL82231.1 PspC domain-containing protein [Winogradskyella sp.]
MNKTVNINLAGIFFHIDEDAYLKLQRYLDAIKRSFTDSQGRNEIIADIEARIAELFTERIQNEKQVVGIKLVDEVITIMGQPEDYLVDDEIFEDQPNYNQRSSSSRSTKKLYRDTDNSYIGGVSSGLGHYLGIDVIWVRLLWILFTVFSGGTFIFIYLIFWALVPEAVTTAEKLMMTGEPVNISNIEKKIKDGIDTVSEKVKNVDLKKQGEKLKEGFEHVTDNISDSVKNIDLKKQSSSLKSSSRNFFDTLGEIIMFFLKVFAKFFGILLIIIGAVSLLSLFVSFFTIGITDAVNVPGIGFIEASNAANIPIWLMSLLLFLLLAIPFFFVFYIGLKILVNNLKSIGNVAKYTLLGLWLISIIGLITIGIKQATEHAVEANVTQQEQLLIAPSDTLRVKMTGNDIYKRYLYRSGSDYKIRRNDNGDQIIYSSDVTLIVKSTTDSIGSISIDKSAAGSNYDLAKNRAENINYNYAFTNNELVLNSFLSTEHSNKLSEQEVEITLYLPVGTILYADDNTNSFHRNYSYTGDILDSGMEEHYLEILNDKVKCLDCTEDEAYLRVNINDKEAVVELNEEDGFSLKSDSLSIEINNKGLDSEKNNVRVKVNDKDGVKITSGKNNN